MSMAKSGTLSGTKKVGMFVKKKSTNFPSQPTGFLKGILAIKEEYTLCVEKFGPKIFSLISCQLARFPDPLPKASGSGTLAT